MTNLAENRNTGEAVDIGSDRLGPNGDAFYQKLMAVHDGLSPVQSSRVNARLVLILANQVADPAILDAALNRAAIKAE